jgi:mannose-6-phosphate isomerase-like protein (cupin superfamily)
MKRLVVPLVEAATGKLPVAGGGGTYRILLDEVIAGTKHFSLLHNEMAPGYQGSEHAHEVEQCFYVLGGRGRFTIGGAPHEVGPQVAVYVPAGVLHRVESVGTEPLSYVTMYAPGGPEQDLRARGYQAFGPRA